jgi:hypothetical protein
MQKIKQGRRHCEFVSIHRRPCRLQPWHIYHLEWGSGAAWVCFMHLGPMLAQMVRFHGIMTGVAVSIEFQENL